MGYPAAVGDFAHAAEATYHEPVVLSVKMRVEVQQVTASRRIPGYDRSQLQHPVVKQELRRRLQEVETPSKHVEQSTRAHVVNESIRGILADIAPKPRKVPRQRWITALTMEIIDLRDSAFKLVKKSARRFRSATV